MVKEYIKQQYGIMPAIITTIALHNIIGGIPHFQVLIYISYIITLIYMIHKKFICYANPLLFFIIYIPINIIITNPNPIFNPWGRFAAWLLVFLLFSPINRNEMAINFRKQCMNSALLILSILTIGSFVCYFLNINLFNDRYHEGEFYEVELGGHFSGLTCHSMILGPISAISMIYLSHLALQLKKKWIWILVAMSIGSGLFASSRSALLGGIAGILAVIFFKSETTTKFLKKIIAIVLLGIVSFPFWSNALDGIIAKNEINTDYGEFGSRTALWNNRLDEFRSSPIVGIGFGAVDETRNKISSNGVIEPGSSWLCILSMTGILGFLLVVIILINSIINWFFNKKSTYLIGIITFFTIHMTAEGYIYAGGVAPCLLLWLTIGCCYDKKNKYKI